MIVLDGATSQPKRSDAGSRRDRAARGSPAATRTSASRCARTSSAAASGASAASRRVVELDLRAEELELAAEQDDTPALNRSPRSTRGTTRTIAYENGLRAARARSASAPPRTAAPQRAAPRDSRRTPRRLSPAAATPPVRAPRTSASTPGSTVGASRSWASRIEPARGSSTCSAISGNGLSAVLATGSRPPCWRYSAAPWSISHSRSCQISRFGLRGVRSTFVVSASSHTMSAAEPVVGLPGPAGVYGSAPGQEVDAEVDAAAAP